MIEKDDMLWVAVGSDVLFDLCGEVESFDVIRDDTHVENRISLLISSTNYTVKLLVIRHNL